MTPLNHFIRRLSAIVMALFALVCAKAYGAYDTESPETGLPQSTPTAVATPLKSVVITGSALRDTAAPNNAATRSARQIDESASLTLEDVVGRMANVSTTYGLTIRGISLYGPNGGNSKTSTVSIDGVPADNFGQEVGGLSVWDVSSVDVLRGPVSTAQGRHALAGAVIVKTRNPTDFWEMRGRASTSDPRGHNVAVAGGGPLVGDVLSIRISAQEQRDVGSVYNQTRNDKRWNRNDLKSLRGKLRLAPSGSDYSALLTLADNQRISGSAWAESTSASPSNRLVFANDLSLSNNNNRSTALEQTFPLAGWNWTVLSTWGRVRDNLVEDYDGSELPQGTFALSRHDSLQTHELRGHFDTPAGSGRLSGVVGGYWSKKKVNARSVLALPAAYFLTELGLCASRAQCDVLYPADSVLRHDLVALAITNSALFTEVDYRLGALTFTAGLRYDRETRGRRVDGITSGDTDAASRLVNDLRARGDIASDEPQRQATDFRVWLPKLGIRYGFKPHWIIGLTAQRGFRTGGVNFNRQLGAQTFDPEFTNNYELSVTGKPSDDLLVTMNVYRIDWRKQQVDIGSNDLSVLIVNSGRSRLHGFELELRGKVTRRLELFAAFGSSRTRFTEFTSSSGDFSGKEFTRSPRQTASLGGMWKPSPLAINLDVSYEGRTFGNPANDPNRRNPSHTLVNAKLSHALGPKARFFMAGLNLLNERYTIGRYSVTADRSLELLGAGRTLRLGFEAEF